MPTVRTFGRFTKRLLRFGVLFGRRWRKSGAKSAATAAQAFLYNGYLGLRNHLARNPRVVCPCCGWQGYEFYTIDCGLFVVNRVECPHCQGHERHRLIRRYLERSHSELFSEQAAVLYLAPEDHVISPFAHNPHLLRIGLDTELPRLVCLFFPGIQGDAQAMAFRSNSFDFIFCLHVLEHVPHDRQAIAEIYRVLKPGGRAFIMVPFMMDWEKTVEFAEPNPAQFGHVRGYSPKDFRERLGPFKFKEITADDVMTPEEAQRFRVPNDSQVLFCCNKPVR